ncbi:MAG: hypothetical protein KC503_25545 [Myxococcales bacterium]|nr:hypothetical protein [Myxococcales bacterium]
MTRRALATVSALAALAAISLPAHAEDFAAKIKAGKIIAVSIPGSGIYPGRAMGIVNAPASTVYQLLADFARYDKFVPRITAARKLDDKHYELKAMFPWPVKETRCKLSVRKGKRGETYVIQWRQIDGTLKKYEGVAWIQPFGKQRTLLTYQMLAVPKVFAPSGLMSEGLRNAVKGYIAAVRTHVAKLRHAPGTNVAAR